MHWWQSLLGESAIVAGFIVVAASIAWLIELGSGQNRNEQKSPNNHQGEASESTGKIDDCARVMKHEASATNPLDDNPAYKQTKPYAYAYLATQIFICVAAGVGIPVAICSLQNLNRSVSVANSQFELSERPWVSVKVSIGGPFIWDERGSRATFNFTYKNYGPSVAVHAWVHVLLLPTIPGKWIPNDQKKLCDYIRTKPNASGLTIFPTEVASEGWIPQMDTSAIVEAQRKWEQLAGNQSKRTVKMITIPFPVLTGCLDYQFTFKSEHHQTGFTYALSRSDPGNIHGNGWSYEFEPMTTIPADKLRLEEQSYGRYAD